MPSVLMTVPHAPIRVTNRLDGRTFTHEPGQTVNVYGAQIERDGREVRVHLREGWVWTFECHSDADAKKYAQIFSTRGQM